MAAKKLNLDNFLPYRLSIASNAPPEFHYALGQALTPLRDDGVLIIGSGSITHNLRALFSALGKL